MANLYMDLFESCPTYTGGSTSPLPEEIMRMNRPFSSLVDRSAATGVPTSNQSVVNGVLSSRALRLEASVGSFGTHRVVSSIYVTPPNGEAKIYIGAAVKFSPVRSAADYLDRPLIGINSAVTAVPGSSTTIARYLNTAILLRSDNTLSIGEVKSEEQVFPVNTYKFVEAVFDPSTGDVDLYIDDALVLQGNLGFSSISAIGFVAAKGNENIPNSGYQIEIDNMYVNDDTGDQYNGRMGPIAVQWAPLKSEDSVTWIPENAPSNITAVNKNTLDTGSFVRSPSLDDQADLYEIDTDAIDPNRVILGVVSAPYFRKTDIGARSLAAVATDGVNKIERTFTDSSLDFSGSTTPLLMPTAPDGTPWDIPKLAACKFGYEVKA